ncbi:MAG: hypothetical protein WCI18_07735 [Pseudomonadota bacterium]
MSNQFDISKLQALDVGLAEKFCLAFEVSASGKVVSVTKNWPLYFQAGNSSWQDMFPGIDAIKLLNSKVHEDCLSRSSSQPKMFRCTAYDEQGRHIFVARALEQYSQSTLEMMCLAAIAQQNSGVAHDLSNMVTILLGYQRQIQVSLEQDPMPVDRISRATSKILDVSNRMVALAASMKSLANRRNLAASVPIDIYEIAAEAMERCEPKFGKYNIKSSLVSESKTGQVIGVSGQISLVLMAVVGWCIKSAQDIPDQTFTMVVEDQADQVLVRMSANFSNKKEPSHQEGESDMTSFAKSWEYSFCHFILSEHRATVSSNKSAENIDIVLSFPKPK